MKNLLNNLIDALFGHADIFDLDIFAALSPLTQAEVIQFWAREEERCNKAGFAFSAKRARKIQRDFVRCHLVQLGIEKPVAYVY